MFAGKLVILVTSLLVTLEQSRSDSPKNGHKDKAVQPLVGHIFVIGQASGQRLLILDALPFASASPLSSQPQKLGEQALERLDLFVVDAEKGIHPMIYVLDAADEGDVKDVWVTVQPKDQEQEPDRRLDALLEQYEKANSKIRDMRLAIEWKTLDAVFGTEATQYGEALVRKPDLVRVDWKDRNDNKTEITFWNGKTLSNYDVTSKKVFVTDLAALQTHRLPADIDTAFFRSLVTSCCTITNDDLQLVYFGLPVNDLKKRFHLTLIQDDLNWAWLRAEPSSRDSKSLYQYIQIAIDKNKNVPGVVQFVWPNGNQTIYKIRVKEINMTHPPSEKSLSNGLPNDWDRTVFPLPDAK